MQRNPTTLSLEKLQQHVIKLNNIRDALSAAYPGIISHMLACIRTCLSYSQKELGTAKPTRVALKAFSKKYKAAILDTQLEFETAFKYAFIYAAKHTTGTVQLCWTDLYSMLKKYVKYTPLLSFSTANIQEILQREDNRLSKKRSDIVSDLNALIRLLKQAESTKQETPLDALITFSKKYFSLVLDPSYKFLEVFTSAYQNDAQSDSVMLKVALGTILAYSDECSSEYSLQQSPPAAVAAATETTTVENTRRTYGAC